MMWTLPVCSKSPAGDTAQGLCDMAGNVWEWVEDCYHDNYDDAPADGSAWMGCDAAQRRVRRGGGWNSAAARLRAAFRNFDRPGLRYGVQGFRVARSSF